MELKLSMKSLSKNLNLGLTLVEILVATSIILVAVVALLGAHTMYLKMAFSNGEVIKGTYLAEESLEVIRFLRDSSWDANIAPLSLSTNYGLVFNLGTWEVSSTNLQVDNIFERTVTLSAVYRDVVGDIVSSGGTLDPDTLLVVSNVSWLSGASTTTKSVSTYIANIYDE